MVIGSSRKFFSCPFLIAGFFFAISIPVTRSVEAQRVADPVRAGEPTATTPEKLDLGMYSRIRDEEFNHSHVMEYAGGLSDDIGPRLSGSPAMMRADDWARSQLTTMGCKNVRHESWGEFGMAWTQINTSLALVKPANSVFVAQATPWSPSTNGTVNADVVHLTELTSENDLARWKGMLKGRIVLYEQAPFDANQGPEMVHDTAEKLAEIAQYPLNGDMNDQYATTPAMLALYRKFFQSIAFRERVGKFFADEGVVAVLIPGGSDSALHVDIFDSFGMSIYRADHKQPIPEAVVATQAWGRMQRLLDNKVPVTVSLNIATHFGDEHVPGYNVLAEIPGTDPKLKDEVVMVGGHLDSWYAGTGATDNGAGVAVAIEAMRVLNALHVQPRRTIRIALWSGEEQGVLGSQAYVAKHFADIHFSTSPDDAATVNIVKPIVAPPTAKSEGALLDAYYNMDDGTGKLLGIYTEGNQGVSDIFSQWMKPLGDLGLTTISTRNFGATDHAAFQLAGLPGFQFIQDPRDYVSRTHHTSLDTYEHLSEPDLKQAAVIEAIFLYNTAMRDTMLPRPALTIGTEAPAHLKDIYPDATK